MNEIMIHQPLQPLPIDLRRGAQVARQLRDYVRQARMTVRMPRGGEHVRIEGWQVLCHLCNLPLPSIVSLRREERGEGYAYIAEAVLEYAGREYRAYGLCSSDEPNWRGKPEFQLASMAQTRAAGKVLRLLLGWIVTLAGYEPTPAEEIIVEPPREQPPTDAPEPEPTAGNGGNGHDHEQTTLLSALQAQDRERYNRILRALQAHARRVFADETARREWIHANYGVWSFRDLTIAQAREAIQLMQDYARQA